MATSHAVRADDGSGKNIGTATFTEDAVTKHLQRVILNDATTVGQMAAVDSAGALSTDPKDRAARDNGKVDIAAFDVDCTVVGKAAHDAAAAGNPILLGGYASAAAPADVSADGDVARIWTTVKGAVHVADGGGTLSVDDGAGALTVDNGGTFAVQVDGNALTALQLIDDPIVQDDAAFTPGTTKVNMAGFQADESSTDSVDEGDGGAARMTLDRKLIVTPQPHTAGGCSIFRSLDLDESEEEVKATAGCVYAMWVTNTATATRFIKFYNATAANVTVGTTTPVITIGIPGNSSDDISGSFGPGGVGITFDTAITAAATTGVADNDTGAPGANEVIVNIFYK